MEIKLTSLLFLLTLATPVLAMESSAVNKWWSNEYQQLQQKQQVEQLQKEAARCETKIDYYHRKLIKKPNSKYYEYKLRSWKSRCKEDKTVNPYIK